MESADIPAAASTCLYVLKKIHLCLYEISLSVVFADQKKRAVGHPRKSPPPLEKVVHIQRRVGPQRKCKTAQQSAEYTEKVVHKKRVPSPRKSTSKASSGN